VSTIKPTGAAIPGLPIAPSDATPIGRAGATQAAEGAAATDPTQRVLGDLTAGRITPDDAVARLTSLAVAGSGAPESARPAVERKVRALLATDPTLGALLGRMGATPPATD
jgi:hypothetical protein